MAFFELNRKIQVILIASGLSMATVPGCKTPGIEPPDNPAGTPPDQQACAKLDLDALEPSITRVNASGATLEVELVGELPQGTEISHSATAKGFTVTSSSLSTQAVTIVLDHAGLQPGEKGVLLLDVKAVCGGNESTVRQRIHLCKQAGGIKILESEADVCEAPPPPPKDSWTSPDVPGPVIVDPAPPPPYDPPPPPPADPPPPPPVDPAPYPYPIPDPVPPPPDASTNKDAAPQPFIVDCVPDAMQPVQGPGMDDQPLTGGTLSALQIRARPLGENRWEIAVASPASLPRDTSFLWRASAGQVSSPDGQTVTWTVPDDGGVHTIMVAVSRGTEVRVEAWKRVP